MPHFQKIGIYANNGTSHVRSAITKLEASLDDFGCGVFFEKTSSTNVGISKDTILSIDDFCAEIDLCVVVVVTVACFLHAEKWHFQRFRF